MAEIKIGLRQIESTDFLAIKDIVDSPFSKIAILPSPQEILSTLSTNLFYAITGHKGGSDIYTVGIGGFSNIDWISRHAQLIFAMVDKDKHSATIQNHSSTINALQQILKLGFREYGFNKIWTEILETNKSGPALEEAGFVVDGICRDAAFKKGEFLSTMILSITLAEYEASIK